MNIFKLILHRLFLVSIIISMKFHEEYYIENRYFFKQASKYCSIYDIKELNKLENIFLKAIDYRLMVSKQEQERYFKLIHNRSLELQFKQFRVYDSNYKIIDDYFQAPKKVTHYHIFKMNLLVDNKINVVLNFLNFN